MTRELDIAWAAGLFEGEGCISHSGGCRHRIIVNLSSTDRDVLERFAAIVGGGSLDERRRSQAESHWKKIWSWRASGSDAENTVRLLLPQLGQRRRTRALELLAARDTHREEVTCERVCPGCGGTFRPTYYAAAHMQTHCTTECYDQTTGRVLKRLSNRRRRQLQKEVSA